MEVLLLTEIAPVKHVKDTSRGSNHYVGHISLELLHLVTDVGATNAGMAGSTHVVSKGKNHLLDLKLGREIRLVKHVFQKPHGSSLIPVFEQYNQLL